MNIFVIFLGGVIGFVLGVLSVLILLTYFLKKLPSKKEDFDREKAKVKVLLKIIECKNSKVMIGDCKKYDKIRNIGIYGAGEIGQVLYENLDKDRMKVKCFIDRADKRFEINGIKMRKPDNNLNDLDLIIMTAYDPYDYISNSLKIDKEKIISVDEFVRDNLYEKR